MKSGHEYPLTENGYKKLSDLLDKCEEVDCFQFDGIIFLGEKIEVIKRYIGINPSKSFYVWCHDNLPILSKSKTNIKSK